MNPTVLILLGLATLVAVGYALPANSEKRPTTELEAHVLERLSKQDMEDLSRSRRRGSKSKLPKSYSSDSDDDCDVAAVIPALTSEAMTCATAALATAPGPPAPNTTVENTALVGCALDLLTNVVTAFAPCLG